MSTSNRSVGTSQIAEPRETPATHDPAAQNFAVDAAAAKRRTRSTWLISLTAVCFVFGGLTAMQLRATETANENRVKRTAGLQEKQAEVAKMKDQLGKEEEQRKALEASLEAAKAKLATSGTLTQKQVAQLNAEIKKVQLVAGLTPVTGPGIIIKLSDDPEVAKAGGVPLPGGFTPGIVHDFDVLQMVNELRAAKAEAIAVNGTRITAYTPIRCVGPTILINWEPAAAPFIIKAVGDPERLASSVNMPNGIVDNLRNNTLGVKVNQVDELELPAAEGVPTMRVVKAEQS